MKLFSEVVVLFAIVACGGAGGMVEPRTAPSSTLVTQDGEVATETLKLPTSVPDMTVTPVATEALTVTPSPTPGVFAISPEATSVPIPPILFRLMPDEVEPGAEIELEGTGGHIELRTADGSRIGFIESAKSFPVFLDGQPIGSIVCFVATCKGPVTIPQDTLPGSYQISMEGGSSLDLTVLEGPQATGEAGPLVLAPRGFSDGGPIPIRYTCDGEDISPSLAWSGVPPGTESQVVVIDDPDAPGGTWDHWVVFNIPADVRELKAHKLNKPQLPNGGVHGKNSWGDSEYGGPCPPHGTTHTYRIFLYAVDVNLDLEAGASKEDVMEAIQGHIVEESLVTGTFGR